MTRQGIASVPCGLVKQPSDFHFVELTRPVGVALVASSDFVAQLGEVEPILVVYLEETEVVAALHFEKLEPELDSLEMGNPF